MCVFNVSGVKHRILITKKYSGILSRVVYFFVAFWPPVNFSSWHFVRDSATNVVLVFVLVLVIVVIRFSKY